MSRNSSLGSPPDRGLRHMNKGEAGGEPGTKQNEAIERYVGGLMRYAEKGIPIYMDGELSGPDEWARLFELREDRMFYMGDYIQDEKGELKAICFDKVYNG